MTEHLIGCEDYVGSKTSIRDYPNASILGFSVGKSRPAEVDRIAYDDKIRWSGIAYRIDRRSPERMRSHGVFIARGTNGNVEDHLMAGTDNSATRLISFSKSERGTALVQRELASEGPAELYRYCVELGAANTFDTEGYVDVASKGKFATAEAEVVTTKVRLTKVRHVDVLSGDAVVVRLLYPFHPVTGIAIDDMVVRS
jgi:hypothetical protein